MKRKDAKKHSTAQKVGGLGLETLRRVSKNFPTELSVKYSTVHQGHQTASFGKYLFGGG